ncbi:hypothetical protein [Caenibacillus caldisaponilyticus]|uniref:hypothetical protein n=1 Tax=Caenibacillus caldisaponilyticus TaxID=1674942 RepID=UPI0009885427|nr:hypothetical protein [Caenibacillus caldisaponilyticus]
MAQLIKLHNYASRYEVDIYRYAVRYFELKRRRYEDFKKRYAHARSADEWKTRFFETWMKKQLVWASSTPERKSRMAEDYRSNPWLRVLLEKLDDTVFILFDPVFLVDDVMIHGDIVLVTPLSIQCVKVIAGEKDSVFQNHDRRRWKEITSDGLRLVDNPIPSLLRTKKIVARILEEMDREDEVEACLLAPESYLEIAPLFGIQTVDRTGMKRWLDEMRHYRMPVKHAQLQAAEALLKHTQTEALPREEAAFDV